MLDKLTGVKNLDLGTVIILAKSATAMHLSDFEEVIYMIEVQGKVKKGNVDIYI